ncbi:MAG: hypothetical protein DWQ19_09945 [Crenarchaeota archaeon]|nr:MAG: hypothetical protein DWQ19_09945 [Thermoproteota archaeon]
MKAVLLSLVCLFLFAAPATTPVVEEPKENQEAEVTPKDWSPWLPAGADCIQYRGNKWVSFRWNGQHFMCQCHNVGYRKFIAGITEIKVCENCACVSCKCLDKKCSDQCRCKNE